MKCRGKAVEIQGSSSEFKMSKLYGEKRPHICRFEDREAFCQMKGFWGGQVRDKGTKNEAENDALKSKYGSMTSIGSGKRWN